MGKSTTIVRHLRIVTKERPADRFLTAQVREAKTDDESGHGGDLYFVVEIHNPWFPNSQVGQTIINTVVREYHRAENTGPLANFEIALRKTNAVLGQITQNGETDWIGNLSSLVVLTHGEHIYLAQTGRARAYLIRGGKLSDITEGLDDEASQHPLTTYTNITSGTMETGDRILLASSQLPEQLPNATIKTLLRSETLNLTGRDLVRVLQKERIKRTNAIILECNPTGEAESETLYLDQTLGSLGDSVTKLVQRTLKPAVQRTSVALVSQTAKAGAWTRDWLVPKLISWRNQAHRTVSKHTKQIAKQIAPQLASVTRRLTKEPTATNATLSDKDLAEAANKYRVLHYEEQAAKRPKKATVLLPATLTAWATRLKPSMPEASPRNLILVAAVIVLAVVSYSLLNRRETQVAQTQATTATTALDDARTNREKAELALAANQTDKAIALFVTAIEQAGTASQTDATKEAALVELTASQTQLDKLLVIRRLTSSQPAIARPDTSLLTNQTGNQALLTGLTTRAVTILNPSGETTSTVALPDGTTSLSQTFLAATNQLLITTNGTTYYTINLTTKVAIAATQSQGWPTAVASASFGGSLYFLSPTDNQIWKFTPTETGFSSRRAYVQDDHDLTQALGLAIDGDVYVLAIDGVVKKFSGGQQDMAWQLAALPDATDRPSDADQIFAHADSPLIYVFEPARENQPARLIAFTKTGAYDHQLVLPTEWTVSDLAFDPVSHRGLALSASGLYPFEDK